LSVSKEKAIHVFECKNYDLYCAESFLKEYMEYVFSKPATAKEMQVIMECLKRGLQTDLFSPEPEGCYALKPFKNTQNDRIICQSQKRENKKKQSLCVNYSTQKKLITMTKKSQQDTKLSQKNTTNSLIEKIKGSFEKTESQDLNHDAKILQARLLSPIVKYMRDENLNQEELAELMNVSQSFISSIFGLKKFMNIKNYAKMHMALNQDFLSKVGDENIESKEDDLHVDFENYGRVKGTWTNIYSEVKSQEVHYKGVWDLTRGKFIASEEAQALYSKGHKSKDLICKNV